MPCNDGGWDNSPRDEDRELIGRLKTELNRERSTSGSIEDALEEELCKSRDTIMKLLKHVDYDNLPKKIQKLVENEKKEHLIHREEDKQAVLEQYKNIKAQLTLKIAAIQNLGGVPGKDLDSDHKKVTKKIKFIESLTDEDLLSDRDLF